MQVEKCRRRFQIALEIMYCKAYLFCRGMIASHMCCTSSFSLVGYYKMGILIVLMNMFVSINLSIGENESV